MQVSGVEISREICDLTERRMKALGVGVDLKVGRNHAIPYSDGFFDTVLACHACYYVDPGTRFADNLRGWFQAIYEVLLGQSQGPRFGSFIELYGISETRALIARGLKGDLATAA